MCSISKRLEQAILSLEASLDTMNTTCTHVNGMYTRQPKEACGDMFGDFAEGDNTIALVKVYLSGRNANEDTWRRVFERNTRTIEQVENILLCWGTNVANRVDVASKICAQRDRILGAKGESIPSDEFFYGDNAAAFQHDTVLVEICQRIFDMRLKEHCLALVGERVENTSESMYNSVWQDTWVSIAPEDGSKCALVMGVAFPGFWRYAKARSHVETLVRGVVLGGDACPSISLMKMVNVRPSRATLVEIYNMEPSLRRLCALTAMMCRGPRAFAFAYTWYAHNMETGVDDVHDSVQWDIYNLRHVFMSRNVSFGEWVCERVSDLLDLF